MTIAKLLAGLIFFCAFLSLCAQKNEDYKEFILPIEEYELPTYHHVLDDTVANVIRLVRFSENLKDSDEGPLGIVLMKAYSFTYELELKDSFTVVLRDCSIGKIIDDGQGNIYVSAHALDDSFEVSGPLFMHYPEEYIINPGVSFAVFKYNLTEKKPEWVTPVKTNNSFHPIKSSFSYSPLGLLVKVPSYKFPGSRISVFNDKDTIESNKMQETVASLSVATGKFLQGYKIDVKRIEYVKSVALCTRDSAFYYAALLEEWDFNGRDGYNFYKLKNGHVQELFSIKSQRNGSNTDFFKNTSGEVTHAFFSFDSTVLVNDENLVPQSFTADGRTEFFATARLPFEKHSIDWLDKQYPFSFYYSTGHHIYTLGFEEPAYINNKFYITNSMIGGKYYKKQVAVPSLYLYGGVFTQGYFYGIADKYTDVRNPKRVLIRIDLKKKD